MLNQRFHHAVHAGLTVTTGSHHDRKAVFGQTVFITIVRFVFRDFHNFLARHERNDHQLLAGKIMLERIVEGHQTVHNKLIHSNIPPVMDTIVRVVCHHLDMRVHEVSVLRRKERRQVVGINDDIGLYLLQFLEINLPRTTVEG